MKAFAKATGKLQPPPLSERVRLVWNAFWELGTCRELGMTIGSIPWTAIDRYSDAERVVDRERFRRLIRALDDAFLADAQAED